MGQREGEGDQVKRAVLWRLQQVELFVAERAGGQADKGAQEAHEAFLPGNFPNWGGGWDGTR